MSRPHLFARGVSPRWHIVALGLLIALSILVKSASWQLVPQVFNDSTGYIVPALSLLDGRGYGAQENGFRTPTYPLFLTAVLAGVDRTHLSECADAHRTVCIGKAGQTPDGRQALRTIVVVQIGLGFLTVLLLYLLGYELTGNLFVGLLWGAGYALNIVTAFWENSILTETLTTLLVVLSVWLTLRALKPNWLARWGLGVTLAALALCHSLFLVYWVVPGAFLFWQIWGRGGWRAVPAALRAAAPALVLPILALLGWSGFNYAVNGFFTPSTLAGYVSIQMVAPVVEQAPSDYQEIAKLYIGYRDALISETGTWSGAIFRAWPTMLTETGLTWSQLSRQLTSLSFQLILSDPRSYIGVAVQGWERFWDFAFYHYDPVPPGAGQWVLFFTDLVLQRALVFLFGLALLVLALSAVAERRAPLKSIGDSYRRPYEALPLPGILLVVLTIAFAAIMSSLTNFQDNARFRSYVLPFQYGVIVLALYSLTHFWRWTRSAVLYTRQSG